MLRLPTYHPLIPCTPVLLLKSIQLVEQLFRYQTDNGAYFPVQIIYCPTFQLPNGI